MEIQDWLYLGMIYGGILFGTFAGMILDYSLNSFLLLSAFLMGIWLFMSMLIEKEKNGNK